MDTPQEKIVGQGQIGIVSSRMHQLMAPVRKVIALRRLKNSVRENSLDSVSFAKENKRLNKTEEAKKIVKKWNFDDSLDKNR